MQVEIAMCDCLRNNDIYHHGLTIVYKHGCSIASGRIIVCVQLLYYLCW